MYWSAMMVDASAQGAADMEQALRPHLAGGTTPIGSDEAVAVELTGRMQNLRDRVVNWWAHRPEKAACVFEFCPTWTEYVREMLHDACARDRAEVLAQAGVADVNAMDESGARLAVEACAAVAEEREAAGSERAAARMWALSEKCGEARFHEAGEVVGSTAVSGRRLMRELITRHREPRRWAGAAQMGAIAAIMRRTIVRIDSRTLLDQVAVFDSAGQERWQSYGSVANSPEVVVVIYNGYNHFDAARPEQPRQQARRVCHAQPKELYPRLERDVDMAEEAELRRQGM